MSSASYARTSTADAVQHQMNRKSAATTAVINAVPLAQAVSEVIFLPLTQYGSKVIRQVCYHISFATPNVTLVSIVYSIIIKADETNIIFIKSFYEPKKSWFF